MWTWIFPAASQKIQEHVKKQWHHGSGGHLPTEGRCVRTKGRSLSHTDHGICVFVCIIKYVCVHDVRVFSYICVWSSYIIVKKTKFQNSTKRLYMIRCDPKYSTRVVYKNSQYNKKIILFLKAQMKILVEVQQCVLANLMLQNYELF